MNPRVAGALYQPSLPCYFHLLHCEWYPSNLHLSRWLSMSTASLKTNRLYRSHVNSLQRRETPSWICSKHKSCTVNMCGRYFHCVTRTEKSINKFYMKLPVTSNLRTNQTGLFVNHLFSIFRNTYVTKVQSFTLKNELYREYLQSLEDKYNSVLEETISGTQQFKHEENRSIQTLQPVVEMFKNVKQKYEDLKELEVMGKDDELKALAEGEMEDLRTTIKDLEDQLLSMLIPPEKVNDCDAILEVECGAGGSESMLFAEEVFNMYAGLSDRLGWKFETISISKGERGYHSASASLSGHGVYQQIKYEGGVHRVQRVPATERGGRTHTSTVTVVILPQPEKIDITLPKTDLKIESMKSSGPGGQNVNKVNSAVRIVHLPTGMVVECQQERSNHQNLNLAMKKLTSRLYAAQLQAQTSQIESQRKIQAGNKERSEKIRTYNFMQDRITDHRIGYSLSHLASFMTGGPGLTDLMKKLWECAQYETVEIKLQEFEKEKLNRAKKVGKKS